MILKSLLQSFSFLGIWAVGKSLMWVVRLALVIAIASVALHVYQQLPSDLEGQLPGLLGYAGFVLVMNSIMLLSGAFWFGYALVPASFILGFLYLDRITDAVEKQHYPAQYEVIKNRPRRAGRRLASAIATLIFSVVTSVLVMGIGLLLLSFALLIGLNGRFIGKSAFLAVAERHLGPKDARAMYAHNRWKIWSYGSLAAVMLAVPWLGLFSGIFASNLMVHLYHKLAKHGADKVAADMATVDRENEWEAANVLTRDWPKGPWDHA